MFSKNGGVQARRGGAVLLCEKENAIAAVGVRPVAVAVPRDVLPAPGVLAVPPCPDAVCWNCFDMLLLLVR